MKTVEQKATTNAGGRSNRSFFSKKKEDNFFGVSPTKDGSFFLPYINHSVNSNGMLQTKLNIGQPNNITPLVQTKCAECEKEDNMIQRQEQPDAPVTKDSSAEQQQTPLVPQSKPSRVTKCNIHPRFPDFGCFAEQLKLDVDENLLKNAHQLYRVATLFPDDKELMWNTFLRYGMGANLLQTSFEFLGTGSKWGKILTYSTGGSLKAFEYYKEGKLELDYTKPLGKGINLDIKLDLTAEPGHPFEPKGVDTVIGISGNLP